MTNEDIDYLVNMYLTCISHPSKDCGWRGESIHSRMITYKGMPPPPSRNDQSNEAMINQIQGLRADPKDFTRVSKLIDRATKGVDKEKHEDHVNALLAKFYYRGVYQKPITDGGTLSFKDTPYDDEERGRRIGQSLAEYRFNVKAGYRYFRRRLGA